MQYHIAWVFTAQIAKFMGPTWGPPGSCRPQIGPMLAPWTLLSGCGCISPDVNVICSHNVGIETVNPLPCGIFLTKHESIFACFIISENWDGTGSWNLSSWKARTYLFLNTQYHGCWWHGNTQRQGNTSLELKELSWNIIDIYIWSIIYSSLLTELAYVV